MKHDSTNNNLKIDELDKDILRQLSKSARTPFKDIAEVCNVSRAAVHQRVQRMIDNGVILGSMFIINPKSVGYRSIMIQLFVSNENHVLLMVKLYKMYCLTNPVRQGC